MTDQPTDDLRGRLQGLWLPLITPFRDDELDEVSLRRLVRHYAAGPVDGFILAATSGEGMSLRADELERLVTVTRSEPSSSSPLRNGVISGSHRPCSRLARSVVTWSVIVPSPVGKAGDGTNEKTPSRRRGSGSRVCGQSSARDDLGSPDGDLFSTTRLRTNA